MRTRDLRPGFFMNEHLASLPAWVRLLFQGLWCIADRNGVLEDRPKRIEAQVFPYEEYPITEGLEQLESFGFIQRYAVGNIKLIAIVTFSDHQRPHPKEANGILPLPSAAKRYSPGEDLGTPQAVKRLDGTIYIEDPEDPEVLEDPEDPERPGVPKVVPAKGTRKTKSKNAYALPDRSGNPRTPEPDFPNIYLSDHERGNYTLRCIERGLRPEFRRVPFERLNSWLGKRSNLEKSVEHYSALIGWAFSPGLTEQTDTDRAKRAELVAAAPLPGAPKETNHEQNLKVLDEFRKRNSGHVGSNLGNVSGLPGYSGNSFAVVAAIQGYSVPGASFGAGSLHQNSGHRVPANHQPNVRGAARSEPNTGSEIHRAQAAHRGALSESGATSKADARGPGEVSAPVRRCAGAGNPERRGCGENSSRRTQA